jgi:hypothetical protein
MNTRPLHTQLMTTRSKNDSKSNKIYSVKTKMKVEKRQNGVVRTNCLDCLDRTNVVQTKICIKVFEDILKAEPCYAEITSLMT